ncbi:hypothetical protein PR048_010727 [Dryococelus australis]|uniref:Uncharacterized protein n=1 Tax=Dryococelus australis TaxID=614101 RepID=A0ABQ9I3I3_9NEOP|nr:hypothetical protein PR048_010727 [Dryococelus australis]
MIATSSQSGQGNVGTEGIKVASWLRTGETLACGNRAGLCRWSAGFLVDLPYSTPLHSGADPYSPNYRLQDVDVKSRPKLSTLGIVSVRIFSSPEQNRTSILSKVKIPLHPPLNPHPYILSGDRGADGCRSHLQPTAPSTRLRALRLWATSDALYKLRCVCVENLGVSYDNYRPGLWYRARNERHDSRYRYCGTRQSFVRSRPHSTNTQSIKNRLWTGPNCPLFSNYRRSPLEIALRKPKGKDAERITVASTRPKRPGQGKVPCKCSQLDVCVAWGHAWLLSTRNWAGVHAYDRVSTPAYTLLHSSRCLPEHQQGEEASCGGGGLEFLLLAPVWPEASCGHQKGHHVIPDTAKKGDTNWMGWSSPSLGQTRLAPQHASLSYHHTGLDELNFGAVLKKFRSHFFLQKVLSISITWGTFREYGQPTQHVNSKFYRSPSTVRAGESSRNVSMLAVLMITTEDLYQASPQSEEHSWVYRKYVAVNNRRTLREDSLGLNTAVWSIAIAVDYTGRGCGGAVFRLHASHEDEPASNTSWVTPEFSHVGMVPDDATGRRVFLGNSNFSRLYIPALLHTHLASPSSALKTSTLSGAHSVLLALTRVVNSRLEKYRERLRESNIAHGTSLVATDERAWRHYAACLVVRRPAATARGAATVRTTWRTDYSSSVPN